MSFFLRVWFPCILLYREYPHVLFKRACEGDTNALVDLLKLDKGLVGEPRIAERFLRLSPSNCGDQAVFQKIARALRDRPRKVVRRHAKVALAGLLSLVSCGLDQKLTAPEIGKLFDAMAQLASGGKKLVDEELPMGESWAKAIQRDRGDWEALRGADKNRS